MISLGSIVESFAGKVKWNFPVEKQDCEKMGNPAYKIVQNAENEKTKKLRLKMNAIYYILVSEGCGNVSEPRCGPKLNVQAGNRFGLFPAYCIYRYL